MDVQTIDPTQRRLKILTADDIDALYGRPTFTPEERLYDFAFSPPAQEVLQEVRTVTAQGWFILQLGYVKAQPVFVPGELAETPEDLTSLLASYFPPTPREDRRPRHKRTRLTQHHLSLALCNDRPCDAHARQHWATKARHPATVSAQPVYIFRALLPYLDEHRCGAWLQLAARARQQRSPRGTTPCDHDGAPRTDGG